jgi:hypothetical protein
MSTAMRAVLFRNLSSVYGVYCYWCSSALPPEADLDRVVTEHQSLEASLAGSGEPTGNSHDRSAETLTAKSTL